MNAFIKIGGINIYCIAPNPEGSPVKTKVASFILQVN